MPKSKAAEMLKDGSADLQIVMNALLIFSIVLYLISNGKLAIRFMFIMVRSL